jgi:uncharacterized protein YkwD
MTEDVDKSAYRRLLRFCTPGWVAVVFAVSGAAVVTIGVVGASSPRDAAGAASQPSASTQAVVRDDASVLGSLGLAPRFAPSDGSTLAAIGRYVQAAARPSPAPPPPSATPTAAPATATAELPSPTPRPALVPAPPAVAPPTATASLPPPPPPPPPPVAAAQGQPFGLDTSPMDAYARALFDDTNRHRVEGGLAPLRVNGYLVGIARIRSHDMADHNYFAHVSPVTGDNAFALMDKHGVPYGWAGENLAKNNYPDNEAVGVAASALWNSPPHRENILNPNYTDMGIALVIDPNGMKYFTVIFTGPP